MATAISTVIQISAGCPYCSSKGFGFPCLPAVFGSVSLYVAFPQTVNFLSLQLFHQQLLAIIRESYSSNILCTIICCPSLFFLCSVLTAIPTTPQEPQSLPGLPAFLTMPQQSACTAGFLVALR